MHSANVVFPAPGAPWRTRTSGRPTSTGERHGLLLGPVDEEVPDADADADADVHDERSRWPSGTCHGPSMAARAASCCWKRLPGEVDGKRRPGEGGHRRAGNERRAGGAEPQAKALLLLPAAAAMDGASGLVVWLLVTEPGSVVARLAYGLVFGAGFVLGAVGVVRFPLEIVRPRTVLAASRTGLVMELFGSVPWSQIESIDVVKRSRATFVEIRYSRAVIDEWVDRDRSLVRQGRGRLHLDPDGSPTS